MLKRVLMSLMLVALITGLVGGATFAVFTSSSTSNNTFNAGTLKIEVGEQTYGEDTSITNLAPRDRISGSFKVTNTGSLGLKFNTVANTSGSLFTLNKDAARVTIDSPSDVVIAPGKSVSIGYHVSLPSSAGSEYQGKSGSLSFSVFAEQNIN